MESTYSDPDDSKFDVEQIPNIKLDWIRDRIGECLGVYDLENTNIMIEKYYEQLRSFVEDGIHKVEDINKKIMFAHRTYYDKLIESTITVLEPVAPPPIVEVVETVKDKKGKKGRGGAKTTKKDELPDTPRSGKIYLISTY